MDLTTEAPTIAIAAELRTELARLARKTGTTEAEVVARALRRLIYEDTVTVPRFARRLGPVFD
jgi:hypothetical protein